MGKRIDLTGRKVGKLTVVDYAYTKDNKAYWNCICECGNKCTVCASNLIREIAKSCGCNKRENMRKVAYKHGNSGTRLYSIWSGMKDRCYNSNNPQYKWYGGKGVYIADEWLHDPDAFCNWARAHGYGSDLTIDRIDFNGPYTPDNCRWVTMKEQQNNKSSNHLLTYQGKTQNINQWAQELGMKREIIKDRLLSGWSTEEALSRPPKQVDPATVEYQGKTYIISELAEKYNLAYDVLRHRILKQGMPIEEALTKPVGRGKVELNGRWDTVANFAKEYGISAETVRGRMKQQGMTLEQALTTPVSTSYSRKTNK